MPWILERTDDASTLSRVGGSPPGALAWPEHDGAPMVHLLTLDVRGLALGLPASTDAVSVFISSVWENEAWEPGTPETAVVHRTEADLAGPAATPPEHDDDDRLEPAGLALKDAAGLSDEELYKHSFAGGAPIWLQGDEGGGTFVLQFDESLVPVNLGDAGIMYVFGDDAWWQCH